MRRGLRFGAAVAVVAGSLLACQILVGIEDDPGVERFPPPPPDATFDASPDVDPCPHAGPPEPPDAGAGSGPQVAFAVRSIRIGGFPDLPRAFDFDKRCSCANRDERNANDPRTSCRQVGDPCAAGSSVDDPEGRDLGAVVALTASANILASVERIGVNPYFERGRAGVLLRVTEYNGLADDARVIVSLFPSRGVEQSARGGPVRDLASACQAAEPADAGTPIWSVEAGADAALDTWYVAGSGESTGTDGYVTNGQLVVNGKRTTYEIPFGGFTIRQKDPIFVAQLRRADNGRWALRGNIVGLVSTAKLLEVIGQSPIGGIRLCQAGDLALAAVGALCRAPDLLESGETDPSKDCDAIALPIGIDAEEAEIGNPAQCPLTDAGIDPSCVLQCDAGARTDADAR